MVTPLRLPKMFPTQISSVPRNAALLIIMISFLIHLAAPRHSLPELTVLRTKRSLTNDPSARATTMTGRRIETEERSVDP